MYNFDLKKVHDLIAFKDVCTTDNEYMTEASSLPHVELDTEPLYVLTPIMYVLFTTKLRYYRYVVENEINRHINAATELLASDGSEELAKFVLKKTRESVMTLVNEANRQLACIDWSGQAWKNITSDNPIVSDFAKPSIEYVVYLHYIIAELARCWLELQDRYAYVIGKAGCYDVSLFYTSNLNRSPDKEFKLERSEKYDDEVKTFKKCRTDCSFLYDNDEYFATAIQEFTNKLKQYNLIDSSVDVKSMMSLFEGHSCRTAYRWEYRKRHILTWIIKGLIKGDNPIITTWPEGTSPWTVVSCRFVDETGKPFPNIKGETERKGAITVVDDVVQALAGYL